jgi:transposase
MTEARPRDWAGERANAGLPGASSRPEHRRPSITPQFKARVVLDVLTGLKGQAELGRRHGPKPELVTRRKDRTLERLGALSRGGSQGGPNQARIAELEPIVGRLDGRPCDGPLARFVSSILPYV